MDSWVVFLKKTMFLYVKVGVPTPTLMQSLISELGLTWSGVLWRYVPVMGATAGRGKAGGSHRYLGVHET